jgi:hypothetical protein
LLCYDICTENRNILMHAVQYSFPKPETQVTHIRLRKRASQDPNRQVRFEFPITDLRLIADQMHENSLYGWDLWQWLMARALHRSWIEQGRAGMPAPGPLPDKPPKPRKLTPYQPPAAGKGAPPPPQPSGA